jgi:O-antigen/teichoic acid export membrane protein
VNATGAAVARMSRVMTSRRVRQAGELYLALIVTLVTGILVSAINARLLGPEAFGEFKLIQIIWTVGVLFFTFGLLTTGGNLLAKTRNVEAERRLMGGLLLISLALSLIFMAAMMWASFPLQELYGKEIGARLRIYVFLLFVFIFQWYLQEGLRGTNDVRGLAFLSVLPQLIYIPVAFVVNYLYGFSLDAALSIYLLSMALAVVALSIRVRPLFSNVMEQIRSVLSQNRLVGFNIYIATLITTSTAFLGQFTLAYLDDTVSVGELSLALTITMPLTLAPAALATAFFKDFAHAEAIPRRLVVFTLLLGVATLLVFFVVVRDLVVLLYTENFGRVVPLAYICATGAIIHGIGDIYNRFLLAQGRTRELRRNAINLGVISVVGYLFLVGWMGAIGAASTKLIVDAVYLASMLYYYRRWYAH